MQCWSFQIFPLRFVKYQDLNSGNPSSFESTLLEYFYSLQFHDSIHDEPPPVCKWNGHDGNLQWQNKIQNNNVLKTIIFKIEKIKEHKLWFPLVLR